MHGHRNLKLTEEVLLKYKEHYEPAKRKSDERSAHKVIFLSHRGCEMLLSHKSNGS